MAKTKTSITLVNVPTQGELTTTNCGSDYYTNTKGTIHIFILREGKEIMVKTNKDVYQLSKHSSINMYHGDLNGVKVQVTLKKMGGKIIYWN